MAQMAQGKKQDIEQVIINAAATLGDALAQGGLTSSCSNCRHDAHQKVRAVYLYLRAAIDEIKDQRPKLRLVRFNPEDDEPSE